MEGCAGGIDAAEEGDEVGRGGRGGEAHGDDLVIPEAVATEFPGAEDETEGEEGEEGGPEEGGGEGCFPERLRQTGRDAMVWRGKGVRRGGPG